MALNRSLTKKKVSPLFHEDNLYTIVKESTAQNKKYYLVWLAFICYIALTTAATTDLQLFLPSSYVKLPLLDIELPLIGFFLVSPFIVLCLHFNLLQNLDSHSNKLFLWLSKFRNQAPSSVNIPNFIFNIALINGSTSFPKLTCFIGILTTYLGGPICIAIIFLRFSDYQHVGMSSWQLFTFALSSGFSLHFLRLNKVLNKKRKKYHFRVIVLFLIFLAGYILLQIYWIYALTTAENLKNKPIFFSPSRLSIVIPKISIPASAKPITNFPSDMKIISAVDGEKSVKDWWEKNGHGVNLEKRNLVYAELPYINLRRANLNKTRLLGAQLSEARLQGAKGYKANLNHANLTAARLQGALFLEAQMNCATLLQTKLQKTNLKSVELKGSLIHNTKIDKETILTGAILDNSSILLVSDKADSLDAVTSLKDSKCYDDVQNEISSSNNLVISPENILKLRAEWESRSVEIPDELLKRVFNTPQKYSTVNSDGDLLYHYGLGEFSYSISSKVNNKITK